MQQPPAALIAIEHQLTPSQRFWKRALAIETNVRRRQRVTQIALVVVIIIAIVVGIASLLVPVMRGVQIPTLVALVVLIGVLALNQRFPGPAGWLCVGINALFPYLIRDSLAGSGAGFSVSVMLAAVVIHPNLGLALALVHLIATRFLIPSVPATDFIVVFSVASLVWLQGRGLLTMVEIFQLNARALTTSAADLEARAAEQAALLAVQQQQTAELQTLLSTVQALDVTVVTLTPQTLLVPMIGPYSVARVTQLRDGLLSRVASTSARTVVLDLTAQQALEPAVVGALAQTIRAVQLLGSRTVLTGIQSDLARQLAGGTTVIGRTPVYRTIGEALATTLAESGQRA